MMQKRAVPEMKALVVGIKKSGHVTAAKGQLKRLAKILAGFEPSPLGDQAVKLAQRCHGELAEDAVLATLVGDVAVFCADVERSMGEAPTEISAGRP